MEEKKQDQQKDEGKDSQPSTSVDFSKLPGPKKAAILLRAVGDEVASKILKRLPEEYVEKITEEMINLNIIPKEVVQNVAKEFVNLSKQDVIVGSGLDYVKRLLSKVFSSPSRVSAILERLRIFMGGVGEAGINTIRNADPATIASFISKEHPQVQAVILAYLGPKKAVEVLQYLPPETHADLIRRIANLDRLGQGVLDEIGLVIDEEFSGMKGSQKVGGLNSVVEIIQNIPPNLEKDILERLEKIDKELAAKIREKLFTFEDLASLDASTLGRILQRLAVEYSEGDFWSDLVTALKGVPEDIRKKFILAFTEKRRKTLLDELKYKGPVPRSEVEEAKRRLVQAVLKLAEQDKTIVLPRKGEEFVE